MEMTPAGRPKGPDGATHSTARTTVTTGWGQKMIVIPAMADLHMWLGLP